MEQAPAPLSAPPLRALPWLAFGSVWAMGVLASLSETDDRVASLTVLLVLGAGIASAILIAVRARTSARAVGRFMLVLAVGLGIAGTISEARSDVHSCCAPPLFILAPFGGAGLGLAMMTPIQA